MPLTPDEFYEHALAAAEQLPGDPLPSLGGGYKAPEEVVVLDEMPLNPTQDRPGGPQADGGGPPRADRSGGVTTPAQDRSTMACMAAG